MLHHVEFNVSDLERSIAFWGWLLKELGYEEFQRWPEGISWKQGDTYLVFVQTEGRFLDHPYHRKRTGLNHIAFHAESKARVDELRSMLEERGVPMLYPDRYPYAGGSGHYAVFFEDPDRMKVEIVARQ
ncbi:VOC family protein [Paenibacillus dendritiformis]|uniref:VOC family protein n=1 Tax=Paenibacillus dendritiformis TaxID=130049 RepID=UPI00248CEBB5|nr:VOC family protein [Paenibacillus dendritiformis]WGU93044.1 VOC family protein [Paenibacillus dendritiformis]